MNMGYLDHPMCPESQRICIPHHSHVATDLTSLTMKGAKFKRTLNCQESYDTLKLELAKRVMLTYLNFSKPFEISTDASKLQLVTAISQDNHPIAFYSRKLSDAQTKYTVIELKLLSIVETLQEFRSILRSSNQHLHRPQEPYF